MKIAIVGAGVSGLVSAHYLQRDHHVVLFDGASRPGGHTNTVDAIEGERPIPIDTGFIVFNEKTYPNFMRLLRELGITWAKSDMSFSVSSEKRNFEYNGHDLSTLFSQKRNLLNPKFLRMVNDIVRFYKEAKILLTDQSETPLVPWLKSRGYSDVFIEDHLLPMVRAVWSANREVAEQFPARFLARFFENHGFLQVDGRSEWLTIPQGARSYVRAILSEFNGELRLGSRVVGIRRRPTGVFIECAGVEPERFDHVVIAAHSDQALAMLRDPSPLEAQTLGAIRYQRNEAVLHTDSSIMPKLEKSWASWNVHLDDDDFDGAVLTYWMNRLQPLSSDENYFVTLNRTHQIDKDRILKVQAYSHPVFTAEALEAQKRHQNLIDHQSTSYAGAYWRNGFHEDGVVSALRVVSRLSQGQKLEVAA